MFDLIKNDKTLQFLTLVLERLYAFIQNSNNKPKIIGMDYQKSEESLDFQD